MLLEAVRLEQPARLGHSGSLVRQVLQVLLVRQVPRGRQGHRDLVRLEQPVLLGQ